MTGHESTGLIAHPAVDEEGLDRLEWLARRMRFLVLEMIHRAGSGHVGSALSCVDLICVLKFSQMNWSVLVPRTGSDVFVLSKGHAVPAWYAALMASGEIDQAQIGQLRTIDSPLQGHPDRTRCDFVDVSTGALGQGLSVALGRAQAKRLKGTASRVFCIVGDGELQEGQVWEALMYAGARAVANIILFVDHNMAQSDGLISDVLPIRLLPAKFTAFGWHVQEIDGHALPEVLASVRAAKAREDAPSVIIAHTRKGYLGPGRVVLNGCHSGTLSELEYYAAVEYLRAGS